MNGPQAVSRSPFPTAPATLEVAGIGPALVAGVRHGGRLERCLADRRDRPSQVGALLGARVVRLSRSSGGRPLVLVDIGQGRPSPLAGAVPGRLAEGDILPVEVTADPREGKAAEVTGDLALAGSGLVFRPLGHGLAASARLEGAAALRAALDGCLPPGGWVLRRGAAGRRADVLLAEAAELAEHWTQAQGHLADGQAGAVLAAAPSPLQRLLADHPGIDRILARDRDLLGRIPDGLEVDLGTPGLVDELPALLAPDMAFADGGRLWFEPTRALMAVDVDAGRMADPLSANLAAVDALARALRLRNIGGLIVVDLLKLTRPADRRQVMARLSAALDPDPETVRVGQMSPLGLVDLARRRRGPRLDEVLAGPDGVPLP